jgi:hypothetical protein
MTESYKFEWVVIVKKIYNPKEVINNIIELIYSFVKEYNEYLLKDRKNFIIDDPFTCGLAPNMGQHWICIPEINIPTNPSNDRKLSLIRLVINDGGRVQGNLDPDKDSPDARELNDFLHKKFIEYS